MRHDKLKKKDIRGKYDLKVKVNKSVSIDTIWVTPDPGITEGIMQLYQVKTGNRVELTETSMGKFLDWVKAEHPEYLKYYGALKNCSFEEMGKKYEK